MSAPAAFLSLAAEELIGSEAECPEAGHAARALVERLQTAVPLAFDSHTPVPSAAREALDFAAPDALAVKDSALAHLRHHAAAMPWGPSGRVDSDDIACLAQFNVALDLEPLSVGIVALAEGRAYPEHSHPPQEVYLVLSGSGSWRYGGAAEYRPLRPGAVLYNPPGVTHGIVAESPILALWVLWPQVQPV